MSFKVSMPPVRTVSLRPDKSSRTERWMAPIELAHAASITQLVPPRSRRLHILPATTFPRSPGNELSCQETYESDISFMISSVFSGEIPEFKRAFRHFGNPSLAPRGITSSCVPVIPRITLVLSLLYFFPSP